MDGEHFAEEATDHRELRQFYEDEGIKAQFTTPYTPEQNGVAERKNRSLQEMAVCMLADADMEKLYWEEAIMTATYLQNKIPSRVVSKTPYELWTNHKPNISHLKVFGCEAYVQIPAAKRFKLDQKSVKLTFVGYSEKHKGYRFVDRSTNYVTINRDARFIELGDGSDQSSREKVPIDAGSAKDEIEVSVTSSSRKAPALPEHEQLSETSEKVFE